jgi:hypothetical protein
MTNRDDHEHDGAQDHAREHGDEHEHGTGLLASIRDLVRPHSHDSVTKIDSALESDGRGVRALIHADPCGHGGNDAHAEVAHHLAPGDRVRLSEARPKPFLPPVANL